MARGLPLPYLPLPPSEYDAGYMNDLVRAVDQFMRQVATPADETFTGVRITDLQSGSDQNLADGVLFQDNGVIFVTRRNVAVPATTTAVGSVGSTTVVTS